MRGNEKKIKIERIRTNSHFAFTRQYLVIDGSYGYYVDTTCDDRPENYNSGDWYLIGNNRMIRRVSDWREFAEGGVVCYYGTPDFEEFVSAWYPSRCRAEGETCWWD